MTISTVGKEWVYLAYGLQSIVEGQQGRNSRQELSWKPWRNATFWYALHSLLSLQSRTTCPKVAVHQSLIKEILLDVPVGQSIIDNSFIEAPFSQMSRFLSNYTKTNGVTFSSQFFNNVFDYLLTN